MSNDDKNSDKLQDAAVLAQMASKKSQGKRPNYFADPMGEQNFSITMALMAELAVARERIDTLERLLVSKGVLAEDDVETYVPDEQAAEERQIAQVEYSARILRSLQQQVEAMEQASELSVDEMADKLSETADEAGSGKDHDK